ncbi:PREDICTED: uncharacterized protein LOC109171655 [Ipomoea nil]|uniref:uncharacterized protein LOC109171655 n=1 Tax=Ipomoea nil TaxID=35883 RepID=UPI000900C809|nr:PREDICTED: uncharacterized protein LOC109171655 [Ipomoea nil]
MFLFKSFETILSKQGIDEKVLIDVIGRIVEIYSPLEKTITGKKSRLIDFVLEDSLKQIKCTLWDEHVDQVTPYFHSAANDPVIVLIQLCRPKIMDNGEVCICNSFGATQLFFSHSCKEFRELRSSSYNSDHTPLRCIDSESRLSDTYLGRVVLANDVLITSIQDIYFKKQLGEYWVAGQIVDVESLSDWYYISCKSNSCKRKVAADGGMMYCGGCKSSCHEGVVRYRVIIHVADQTGDAPMLIWDPECAELVGVSAGNLKAKYPEGNKCIPPELGYLWDMSMLFRVAMKKEQIESYYSAFTVLKICRDEAVLTQHCSGLSVASLEPENCSVHENGFQDADADGDAGSKEFYGSDDKDCVVVEDGSQGLSIDKFVGLDEIEDGLGVGADDVPLKRSLFNDIENVGPSKKAKEVVVKKEK